MKKIMARSKPINRKTNIARKANNRIVVASNTVKKPSIKK